MPMQASQPNANSTISVRNRRRRKSEIAPFFLPQCSFALLNRMHCPSLPRCRCSHRHNISPMPTQLRNSNADTIGCPEGVIMAEYRVTTLSWRKREGRASWRNHEGFEITKGFVRLQLGEIVRVKSQRVKSWGGG
ncbi:hypothetical protein I3760_11G120600 [Carya illinoinensis]|nr:hypothetical protein I3760_11G120600 [Carya illinoinensis]